MRFFRNLAPEIITTRSLLEAGDLRRPAPSVAERYRRGNRSRMGVGSLQTLLREEALEAIPLGVTVVVRVTATTTVGRGLRSPTGGGRAVGVVSAFCP